MDPMTILLAKLIERLPEARQRRDAVEHFKSDSVWVRVGVYVWSTLPIKWIAFAALVLFYARH